MKRIILFLLVVVFSKATINAQENNFKDFYKNHKREAVVSFNIPLFLVKSFISEDDIDEEILKKAKNFKLLVYDKKDKNIVSDFKKFSRKNNLKTLLKVKDGKDKVSLYFREEGDFINEIILVTGSDEEELVFMGLKTKELTKDELALIIADKM